MILSLLVIHTCQLRLVINEINSDDPVKPESKEFIELKAFPNNELDRDLNGYVIIVVQMSKRGNPIITTVIDLVNAKVDGTDMFVVGGLGLESTDMKITDPRVQYRYKFTSKQPFNFIPNGDKSPMAVGLLYVSDPTFVNTWLRLQEPITKRQIPLEKALLLMIKTSLVDLVVYARSSASERCPIFEELRPEYASENDYMLRDFDQLSAYDYAIERCTELMDGFMPKYFQTDTPTPKVENLCSGIRMFFREKVYQVANNVIRIPENRPMEITDCSSDADVNVYESVNVTRLTEYKDNMFRNNQGNLCRNQLRSIENNAQLNDISVGKEILESMGSDESTKLKEWESTSHFDLTWLTRMRIDYPETMPHQKIATSDVIKAWFEYHPDTKKFGCRNCRNWGNQFALNPRIKSGYTDPEGKLPHNSYQNNLKDISGHSTSVLHTTIVDKLIQFNIRDQNEFFDNAQRQEQVKHSELAVTMRLFQVIYSCIKAGVSFSKCEIIVELEKMHGVDIGSHFHYRVGFIRITRVIGDVFKTKLKNHLTCTDYPLSLLVDTSNDNNHNKYLSVLIQTIEKDRPIVYFYRLLELKDETGAGMFDALFKAFHEDEIDNIIRDRLTGFASDGAASMTGKDNGLAVRIRRAVKHPIYVIHCSAHRLQLALDHALDSHPFKTIYVKFVNDIHNFYMSHSYARYKSLKDTALKQNLKLYKLNRIFDIRWVQSEANCIRNLIRNWPILVENLNDIKERDKSPEVRKLALEYRNTLLNRNFIAVLHLKLDILEKFEQISERLQIKGQTVIGLDATINIDLIDALGEMRTVFGNRMAYFLGGKGVTCPQAVVRFLAHCPLEIYESDPGLTWQNVALLPGDGVEFLSKLRLDVIMRTSNAVIEMFPREQRDRINIKSFDVFKPELLPKTVEAAEIYGISAISQIYDYFRWGFEKEQLLKDWQEMLKNLITNLDVRCDIIENKPHIFWSSVLKNSEALQLKVSVKQLIRTVLVIPVSSSDVERSFSFMNIISNIHTNIEGVSLESLLRIVFNGPNRLSEFRAFDYAKEWVYERHHSPADSKTTDYTQSEGSEGINPKFTYLDRSELF